jgi:hypothetical protein
LQALGRMGKAEQALFVIRKCYGGMIELGATTFWETFAQAPEVISGSIPWMGAFLFLATPCALLSACQGCNIEQEWWWRRLFVAIAFTLLFCFYCTYKYRGACQIAAAYTPWHNAHIAFCR